MFNEITIIGPGLIGALMVGINMAKSIAYSRDLPLIGIHHLEGHTYAAWLEYSDPAIDPGFPLIVLIASGAHTDLILMEGHGKYECNYGPCKNGQDDERIPNPERKDGSQTANMNEPDLRIFHRNL